MCVALITQKDFSSLILNRVDQILALPDEEAAAGIDQRIKAYNAADVLLEQKSFSEFGRMAFAVQERSLWKQLDNKDGKAFSDFNEWASSYTGGACRAKLFESKKVYEELREDLKDEEMEGISRGNLKTLVKIPPKDRADPETLEAARNQEPREFHNFADKKVPNAHLDQIVAKKLKFEESGWDVVQQAIDAKKEELTDGKMSDEEAIEYIAQDWLEARPNPMPEPETIEAEVENEDDF